VLCFGIALASASVRYVKVWEARVPNGVPVAAHFGDRIIVSPLVAGTISFAAYPLTVQSSYATHDRPAIFSSSGNDTYEVTSDHDGALDVALEAMQPMVSPWLIALLLLCATAAAVLATLQTVMPMPARYKAGRDLSLSSSLVIGSLVLFLLVPRSLHNDQLGGGINWGYLGWGYVDTLQALPLAVAQSGLIGLTTVESLAKPILYALIASPLSLVLGALNAAVLVSALCAALATLGIYRLGRLIFDPWVGVTAAVLFAFSPLALAYATAFYLDIPYVMFVIWSAVFLIGGLKEGKRMALIVGVLLGVLAVGVRNPVMAGLYFLSLTLLMLASRIEATRAVKAAFLSAVASFLGAVFLWPFLWIDTAHRLPFVLVARLLFDQYYHLTESLTSRAGTMAIQTFVHTDPLTVVLLFVGAAGAALRRDVRVLWLGLGVVAARLFVAPTSYYLQHYWFYMVPFLQLVAASTISLLSARLRAGAVVVASAAVLGWSALYFPYPSSATLGCLSFACSVQRWGVDEPVYGLKEAARWIREHVPGGAVVGTLVAPHVLQVQLQGYAVRFVILPPDRERQEAVLADAGVDYLVANAWTRYRDRERVRTSYAQVVWRSAPRDGMVTIFKLKRLTSPRSALDAPPTRTAASLLARDADRIVVYPRSVSYHGLFADRQVVTVSERVHPLTDFGSLLRLGGGVALLAADSGFSAFDYEEPVARDGRAAAEALPTLRGMQQLASVPLSGHALTVATRPTTVFSGDILPQRDERFFADIFEVSARADKPFSSSASIVMQAKCDRASVPLSVVWIDRTDVRGYAAAEKPLAVCLRGGRPLGAYISIAQPSAGRIHALARLLWNGDNALVRAQRAPLRVFATHPLGQVRNLIAEDDVRSFVEAGRSAALVVPKYQTRFDLQAAGKVALSDRAVLLTFSQPSGSPQGTLRPLRYGCRGCRSVGDSVRITEGGTATWVWAVNEPMRQSGSLGLDVSTLRIDKGRAPQAVLQALDAGGKGCAQWDFGPMRRGHTINLLAGRFSERGCRLSAGTQLAYVLYAPRGGVTLSVQPLLRVWR